MVFPTSKLPSAAQPWGRFVEKSITNVETLVSTERVNNAARDAQNSLNIKRLDQSVTAVAAATIVAQQAADDAQAAIDGITSLGSIDSPYTINAGNINAGVLTGVTIQSATSGQRVVINTNNVGFYNSNGYVGRINGGTNFSNSELSMLNSNSSAAVYVDDTTANLYTANGASFGVSSSGFGGATLFTPNLNWQFNGLVAGRTTTSGGLDISGTVTTGSSLSVGTSLTVSSGATISGSVTVGGNLSTDGSLTRTALAGGGSTTATINNAGQFIRTTSSARYKQDVESINVPLSTVLQMEPRKFRLIEEVESDPDARYYGGFIAEELDALGLDTFVGYQKLEDGTVRPESVYYAELTAVLVSAIKELNARIETLEGK